MVAARTAKQAGTLVILDVGGRDEPLSEELLHNIDIISPNEVSNQKHFRFCERQIFLFKNTNP